MVTMLNCGHELGELVEAHGSTNLVIGESVDDAYKPESEQQWFPEFEDCRVRDDGRLEIDHWFNIPDEAKSAIIKKHGAIRVGTVKVRGD